jgi:hypothetical protein
MFSIYLILPAILGLGFTQTLTEMSIRKRKIMFLGSRTWPLTTLPLSKPIVYTIWDPQHLTTLQASAACYGDIKKIWL